MTQTTCKICPKAPVAIPMVLLLTVMGKVVRKLPVIDCPLCNEHRRTFRLAEWLTEEMWIRMKATCSTEPPSYQPFRPQTQVRFLPWRKDYAK